MPVLGHLISNDSSNQPCYRNVKKKAWGAFWRSAGSKAFKKSSLELKLKLMDRTVSPVVLYRSIRWPASTKTVNAVHSLQTQMIRILMATRKNELESVEAFVIRRNAAVGRIAKQRSWREITIKRQRNWQEHLIRDRNWQSPASKLLRWHNTEWLEWQRILHRPHSRASGTGSRLIWGPPLPRWEESLSKHV